MIEEILKAIGPMRNARLGNYIAPGLTSVLIGGDNHGKVRLFESSRETLEFITPHSHRFDFTAIVLEGWVVNTLFLRGGGEDWCRSHITQVCGTGGIMDYEHKRETSPFKWYRAATTYKAGATYSMKHSEIHSIRFSGGAKVLMFEGPQLTTRSVMLEPWVDGRVVPTFRTEGWMFQRGE